MTLAFMIGRVLAAALAVSAFATAASAYTADQQQACTDDAFRLCGPAIPDVERVTACMIANQAQLTPRCRAFFRPEPARESMAPATASRPLSIKPGKKTPQGKIRTNRRATKG